MKIMRGLLALAALAGTASADIIPVPSNQTMFSATATDLDAPTPRGAPVYSSIPGPYFAFAAGAFAHRDDYVTSLGGPGNFTCDALRFVGGVTAVGMILDFFLLDPLNNVVSSFGVTFPQAGNFIWTITLGAGLPAAQIGQFQIQNRAGSTGQWFMTTTAPSVGTNNALAGHGSTLTPPGYGAYELQNLPAPGALALLGLGGLMAARRRR